MNSSNKIEMIRNIMNIIIDTLTGKSTSLKISYTDTVADYKQLICDIDGIPPVQQRLIYEGRQLDDNETVADINKQIDLHNNSVNRDSPHLKYNQLLIIAIMLLQMDYLWLDVAPAVIVN
jgi:hypothetical protein